MFRLSCETKSIILIHDRGNFARMSGAKLRFSPVHQELIQIPATPARNVPTHLQEKFDTDFSRLQIPDIEHPQFAHAMIEGLRHLLPDLCGWCRVQPKIRERTAEIRDVIVDTEATGAF